MDHPNPYAPPKAPVADPAQVFDEAELATRMQRLGAVILDGLVTMIWGIPLGFALGMWTPKPHHGLLPSSSVVLVSLLSTILFLLVNARFLHASGQTLGKRWVGIRIVTLDNTVPELWRIIVLRFGSSSVVPLIPVIGSLFGLIDILLIFGERRRCLHDLIAGTKVVRA